MNEQIVNGAAAPLEGGTERSGGPPSRGAAPNPEVSERATRRRFSAEYKARIVREASACVRGEIGALLRREGLFASQLASWRAEVRAHGEQGLAAKKRGPAPKAKASAREVELERKTKKLEKQLAKAEAIIAFQKKAHELLGIPLKNHEFDEVD